MMNAVKLCALVSTTVLLGACKSEPAPAPPHAAEMATTDDEANGDSPDDEGGDEALPAATATSPTLLAEADRELSQMKSTAYQHHLSVDPAAGRYDYDCSAFVGYASRQVHPNALEPIPHPGHVRPVAAQLELFFAGGGAPIPGGGAWERVGRVKDIAPGDVVAWKKPLSSHSKNTGHVVIAHAAPRPDPRHPGEFLLDVVDSTAIPHGATDPRHATKATGLGQGTIGLVPDAQGAPRAFRWSPAGPEKETPIAIGRLR